MFCEKCGTELPEEAVFCLKCGAEQRKTTEASNKIERIHFDLSPTYTMSEPKKSKAPVFAVTGLVLVLVAAVTVLVASVFGQGNAKKVVEAAVEKTIQILQEETAEGIVEGKKFGYFLEVTGDYYKSSYTSDEITKVLEELGDFRFLFYGNLSEIDQGMYGSIEVGTGDMKNIRLNYEMEKDGLYLFLPDLYERAFFIPQEFLEGTTGTDIEEVYNQKEREEALRSLGNIFSDTYHELYAKAKCAKIGKETLEAYENEKVTCYEVTVSVADYQKYLEDLFERLEGDSVFINWLTEISSKQVVEEFLDTIQEDIKHYQTQIAEEADFIILGNVYVDKKGRMVQLKIPFEDEGVELIVSFLGKERLIDDISIQFYMDDGYNAQKVIFHYQLWDENQLQSIAIDKKDILDVVERNQEELGVALIEILCNISDGGYLPSQYRDDLDELLLDLSGYADGNYNFNDNDEWYNSWEYELTYSEDGNPILEDYLGKYQIELIAPPGTILDLNWSYPEMICFMDEGEEQDYYYEIKAVSDDVTDRFDYERMYLSEEEGYKNIVFSDIMQKEINGYQVYYQYCSYDYDFMVGYKTYYAWVRLDEEYVFELYLDDYTNSVEDDILDGCFQAVLPIK